MPTIPENSTPQEVFDYVAKHLIKQGRQSWLQSYGCAYRGEGGLSCAAGCLVTDEEYAQATRDDVSDLEGSSAFNLSSLLSSPFWKRHEKLIQELQLVHDNDDEVTFSPSRVFLPAELKKKLAAVAKDFNLNTEALNA